MGKTKVADTFWKVLLAALFVLHAGPAFAEWPEKAIDFIIPFSAGGGADIEGRLLAKEMSKELGVPIVPINKPGAGGAVTYTYVKDAKPDGYTLGWNSLSILTTTNIGNVPFDYSALEHVGRSHFQPFVFVVNSESEWNTFEEIVSYCKSNPKKLKIGHHGTGSSTHLAAVVMQDLTGCEATLVPGKKTTPLLNGEVDAMTLTLTSSVKLWQSGKFRILTHFTDERNPVIPDVPTMSELGYDIALEHFRGISVPAGTPEDVKEKIAAAIKIAANSEVFTDLAKNKGFTVAPLGPAEFEKMLAERNELVANIMQDAGIYRTKEFTNK